MNHLAELSRVPRVTAYADAALAKVGIKNNPYFQDLQSGAMSLEVFQQTQEQFYFIVIFFARPMAALVSRIPDPKARRDILHNVVEEHGNFQEDEYHEATIRRFVQTLGSKTDFDTLLPWPEVYALNSILMGICTQDEIEVGVCCLGIIEYAFMSISATIARTVIKRGWVKPDELVHYNVHAEIDSRHAAEFFAVVEPLWDDPSRRPFIEQGLELGAYIWDRLYRDMYAKALALTPVSV